MADPGSFAVVVCTRNRAQQVHDCLESVQRDLEHANQDSARTVEVLVVDNGSTDSTSSVLASAQQSFPALRVVHEPTAGVSVARNRGVAETRAEVVVFLDDDATVQPGWLSAFHAFFAEHPEAMAAGGAVELAFEGPRPRWLTPHLERYYSALDVARGDAVRSVHPVPLPVGANVAMRRSVFEHVGAFDPSLGRVGNSLISGEETALLDAVRRAGHEVWLTGGPRVWHHVPAQRLRFRWIMRRVFDGARTDERMRPGQWSVAHMVAHLLFGGPRYLWANRSAPVVAIAGYALHRTFWAGRLVERWRPGR